MKSVTSSPAGRRPTFLSEEKSTYIIIGVIMSQIRTAMGALIWLPLPNSRERTPATAEGSNSPKPIPATIQSATHMER